MNAKAERALSIGGSPVDQTNYCPTYGLDTKRDDLRKKFWICELLLWSKPVLCYVNAIHMLAEELSSVIAGPHHPCARTNLGYYV